MKEKLDFLCEKYNLSASSLAKTLGVEASAISHIRSGRNKPSYDFVVKILRAFPDVNPDWLLLDGDVPLRGATSTAPLSSNLDADFDAPLFKEVENIKTSESSSIKKNEEFDIFNSPTRGGKTPQRVILLYADGSFESYEHK